MSQLLKLKMCVCVWVCLSFVINIIVFEKKKKFKMVTIVVVYVCMYVLLLCRRNIANQMTKKKKKFEIKEFKAAKKKKIKKNFPQISIRVNQLILITIAESD